MCMSPNIIIDTLPNGEGCTNTDTIDTTDYSGGTATNTALYTQIDSAIDEALKSETEKLYEEACSIVNSSAGNFYLYYYSYLDISYLFVLTSTFQYVACFTKTDFKITKNHCCSFRLWNNWIQKAFFRTNF